MLGLVESQADRLDRLVTNLLDMTRIQAGALEPLHQAVRVDAIVDDAIEALGPANGPADLHVDVPEDLPLVDVDRLLVVQALANLLENAARFAPEGTPVTVRAATTPTSVRVSVEDQGPGVPPTDREGLFEMFSRRGRGWPCGARPRDRQGVRRGARAAHLARGLVVWRCLFRVRPAEGERTGRGILSRNLGCSSWTTTGRCSVP